MSESVVRQADAKANVTLIFPAVDQEATKYRAAASQRGEQTICASSVGALDLIDTAEEQFWLPMIYDDAFPARFLALIRDHSIARVYCPVATVYAFLTKFIATNRLPLNMVGESPVAQQIMRHKELMARARRVHALVCSLGDDGNTLSLHEIASILKYSATIYGESNDDKLGAMMAIACLAPRQDVVEIGCLMGRSAFVMLFLATRYRLGPVLTIDPWTSAECTQDDSPSELQAVVDEWDYEVLSEGFLASTALMDQGRHCHLRLPSSAAIAKYESLNLPIVSPPWSGRIGMIHIDGNHDYDAVADDCRRWVPHIAPSGWLVLDDYVWAHGDGPYRAGNELLEREAEHIERAFVCGKALFIRWSDESIFASDQLTLRSN